jgi:hypothetical protein
MLNSFDRNKQHTSKRLFHQFGATLHRSHHHPPFPAENKKKKECQIHYCMHQIPMMREGERERATSSGVCSARRRRPSNKKAIELNSTDCRSQYAFISFFSWVLLLILKKTSFPSCNSTKNIFNKKKTIQHKLVIHSHHALKQLHDHMLSGRLLAKETNQSVWTI